MPMETPLLPRSQEAATAAALRGLFRSFPHTLFLPFFLSWGGGCCMERQTTHTMHAQRRDGEHHVRKSPEQHDATHKPDRHGGHLGSPPPPPSTGRRALSPRQAHAKSTFRGDSPGALRQFYFGRKKPRGPTFWATLVLLAPLPPPPPSIPPNSRCPGAPPLLRRRLPRPYITRRGWAAGKRERSASPPPPPPLPGSAAAAPPASLPAQADNGLPPRIVSPRVAARRRSGAGVSPEGGGVLLSLSSAAALGARRGESAGPGGPYLPWNQSLQMSHSIMKRFTS